MFGIGMGEFLVILVVAVAVIPAKDWPVVAKFLARAVRGVRNLIWKITDAAEDIKEQIEREIPIDKLSQNTFDDVAAAFRAPVKKRAAGGRKNAKK